MKKLLLIIGLIIGSIGSLEAQNLHLTARYGQVLNEDYTVNSSKREITMIHIYGEENSVTISTQKSSNSFEVTGYYEHKTNNSLMIVCEEGLLIFKIFYKGETSEIENVVMSIAEVEEGKGKIIVNYSDITQVYRDN